MVIKQFNPKIEHTSGSDYKVVDAVSRPSKEQKCICDNVITTHIIHESKTSTSNYESSDNEKEIIGPDSLNRREIPII